MVSESKALHALQSELASRLVRIEDEIHRRGLKTIRHLTLIARDEYNDNMFVCVTNETYDGLQKATALALAQNPTEQAKDPLYIVVAYDEKGRKEILAVKATKAEAEAAQTRWVEIVHNSDIEEWRIGDELEVQP